MPKTFRPSNREARIISRIESSKERARQRAISQIKEQIEPLSNALTMKLIENRLLETNSKEDIQKQISKCLDELIHAEEFEIAYQIAPFKTVVPRPNIISLYVTAFVIEKLINHKSVIDIFGSDEDIYRCINDQFIRFIPDL
nr:hypothetical protein [Desulfobacterales bacterium]